MSDLNGLPDHVDPSPAAEHPRRGLSRRNLVHAAGATAAAVGAVALTSPPAAADTRSPKRHGPYTFELDADVVRRPVRYENRYGIELAGDLYLPRDLDRRQRHRAVVIGPPHGGVKEQGPGVYANALAQRGLIALAFDPSYNGQSSGTPRHITSPELFAEDFSAGVDLLGTQRLVDRDRIGGIGICGSGGFLLSQASVDTRIKAVVTSAMYDISRASRHGFGDTSTDEQRRQQLESISQQRWDDVDARTPALSPVFPDEMPAEGPDPITREFWEYYVEPRGHHPRSIGGFTITSNASHVNFGRLRHVHDIAPRPVLMITGDQAHSRYFSEGAYTDAAEPKELHVVPGARHIDLYDRTDLIPFAEIEAFLTTHL